MSVPISSGATEYGARAAESRRCLHGLQPRRLRGDGRSAIAAARQAGSALDGFPTYIDLNSVSPTTKRRVADEATRRGSGVRGVRRHGAGQRPRDRRPDPGRGGQAEEVAATQFARNAHHAGEPGDRGRLGDEACRSIVIKGLEALMVDLNLAAEKAGVLPAVLASLTASYPNMDWAQVASVMPCRVERHGRRRAAEMREVSRMMSEHGLDGSLAEAIADRHESFAGLQLRAPSNGTVDLTVRQSGSISTERRRPGPRRVRSIELQGGRLERQLVRLQSGCGAMVPTLEGKIVGPRDPSRLESGTSVRNKGEHGHTQNGSVQPLRAPSAAGQVSHPKTSKAAGKSNKAPAGAKKQAAAKDAADAKQDEAKARAWEAAKKEAAYALRAAAAHKVPILRGDPEERTPAPKPSNKAPAGQAQQS